LDEKAAGLRTHMLVAAGSALFTLVGAYGFSNFLSHGKVVSYDPSRIAAQIVTGIGFLGAGVIFRQGFTVRGLTTAASLWLVAAIGMAAGAGYWAGAVLATGVGIVSLRPLEWLKNRLAPQRAAQRMVVELADNAASGPVLDALERSGDLLALRRDGRRVEIEMRIDRNRRSRALDAVAAVDGVQEARWTA
jgi:putative Mg2+ transporter-C (MgtC) family protein